MSSRKFSFLSSSTSKSQDENNDSNMLLNNIPPILDTKVMEYVVSEFKEPTENISKALKNLKDTIENSIDYIEDKSSELVKGERNFELSGKYRETSMRLHEISESINTYLQWIEHGSRLNTVLSYSDYINNKYPLSDLDTSSPIKNQATNNEQKNTVNNKKEEVKSELITNEKALFIYEDFTGYNPKSFLLKTHSVTVDSWDDMLVQTASILTKNYKHLKDTPTKFQNNNKVFSKKSLQNDLRDTIIEMLVEHKIPLNEYKVFI